jgi:hypothetical protein
MMVLCFWHSNAKAKIDADAVGHFERILESLFVISPSCSTRKMSKFGGSRGSGTGHLAYIDQVLP